MDCSLNDDYGKHQEFHTTASTMERRLVDDELLYITAQRTYPFFFVLAFHKTSN